MAHSSKPVKLLITALKLVLAVAILAFLVTRIQRAEGFERLLEQPKEWRFLLLAQVMVLVSFSLSFTRWFLLVRAIDLPFRLQDAFRLGSLGFLLNQVSPGSVGGDLLKAVFLAREQQERRMEAIATVFIDRVVGLYAMLLIASAGLAMIGTTLSQQAVIRTMQTVVWTSAICCTAGVFFVLSPLATGNHARALADRLPLVGHMVTKLIEATDVYRSRREYLGAALMLALATHSLLIASFWCVAQALPVFEMTFIQNASLVPIGLVAGALPFTPGGLGALEAGMEFLYSLAGASQGDGTIVALGYRLLTYVVAAIGAAYYISAKRKVDRMLDEAETLAEEIT